MVPLPYLDAHTLPAEAPFLPATLQFHFGGKLQSLAHKKAGHYALACFRQSEIPHLRRPDSPEMQRP